MRIFMFTSRAKPDLRAFAGDSTGSKLPEKYAPWDATGVIRPDKAPPHRFSRDEIERAIGSQGFQLWRMKPPETATAAAPDRTEAKTPRGTA
jgi:hypothetical protein